MKSTEHRIALSIDVEEWYHSPIMTGSTFSQYLSVREFFEHWNEKYDYLSGPTKVTLDILNKLGLKATFFIVGDLIDSHPGLVESIASHGHEIACHGLHHEMIVDKNGKPRWSKDKFRNGIKEAKSKLEIASGENVIGFRAPSAYIGGWMLDILEELGFKYDSSVSINSLYNKMEKKPREVTTTPYFPAINSLDKGRDNDRKILEIPWPYYNVSGFKLPTAGGPFLRFFGARYILAGLNQCLINGDTVFYFHPQDISSEKLPIAHSRKRPFYFFGKGRRARNALELILGKFKGKNVFTTCNNIRDQYDFLETR